MNDQQFLRALEDTTLPPAEFSHRNHLRAAWLYLDRYPLPEAARRSATAIQRYATAAGAPGKFHLTLTLAFMHIIAALREAHPQPDWESFLAACPELLADAKGLVARHYSDACLAEERARREFVPPDRLPLPFHEPPAG